MEDYYKILGIEKTANSDEIKKKYRKLSMKHHPDRGGSKDTFQKINEAYQILGDDQKRKMYDVQSNNPLGNLFGENANQMDGLFNMFFGGQMPNGMGHPNVQIFRNGIPVNNNMNINRKPPTIVKSIEVTLKQAYIGINYPIEIERWIREDNTRRIEKEKLYIDIPMGTDDGEIIIIKDKGNIGLNNILGDIKLHIKVKNNSYFVRDGLDLLLKKTISLKEALLGFIFEIEHLSGKSYKINNTNGTIIRPFYKKNVNNLGMKRKNKNMEMVGNLIISFEVLFPKNLTDDQKEELSKIL
jgi:DnaJ-class molecular chaperone